MVKNKNIIGIFIISSAIIWGAVMIGCSFILKETGCYNKIQNLLLAGFVFHLLFVWAPFVILDKKDKKK